MMKRIRTMFFGFLLSLVLFPLLSVQAQELPATNPQVDNLRFGGFARSAVTGLSIYNAYGFDYKEPSAYYLLHDLLNKPGSWGIAGPEQTLQIQAGAWTGKEWIIYTQFKDIPKNRPAYYLAIEPLAGKIRKIGKGDASNSVTPTDMAYDPSSNKMYGIDARCLYAMSLSDTSIQLIDSLRISDGTALTEEINVIACNSKGSLYVISTKNNVYKLNAKNAQVVLIGNTGTYVSMKPQLQSACFDYRSDRMYWASYNPKNLFEIDTLTGLATTLLKSMPVMTGLFVHNYTENSPPGDPTQMKAIPAKENPLQVSISAKAPSLNFNGQTQTALKKAYLYRTPVLAEDQWQLIDSTDISAPASDILFNVSEKKAGIYKYGLRIKDIHGMWNLSLVQNRVNCFRVQMPYSTGFEEGDNNSPVSIEVQEGWVRVDSNARAGQKSYYIYNASKSQLRINGMPVKKGAKYKVTFCARNGTGQKKSSLSAYYGINGKQKAYNSIKIDLVNTWYEFVMNFEADENGLSDIWFCGAYKKAFFIDDFKIEQISSEKVPDTVIAQSFTPAPLGELALNLKWKNPSTDASGGALEHIRGVVIQSSLSSRWDVYDSDTVFNPAVGSETSLKLAIKKPGKRYLRFYAYNDYGVSPYVFKTEISGWIGNDTVPNWPKDGLAETLEQGKIKLTWKAVPETGVNGGYLDGKITGYRIIRYPGHYKLQDSDYDTVFVEGTEYITSSLPDGAHGFRISAVRNHLNYSANQLAGAFAVGKNKHVVVNTDRSLNNITLPLNIIDASVQSTITQVVYTPEEMGGAKVIDSIIWFVTTEKEEEVPVKIYFDYKTSGPSMANNEDWTSIRQKSTVLVYEGKVKLYPNNQRVAIPVKTYFYDASSAFLLTVIKPMCVNNKRALFYGTTFTENRAVCKYEKLTDKNATDFDTLSDVHLIRPYKVVQKKIPGLVISQPDNLASISGTVKKKRDQEALKARIYIETVEAGKNLDITYAFDNDSANSGSFSFNQLVPNTYKIRISAFGYTDTNLIVKLEPKEQKVFEISLDDADKIKVSGVLTDVSGNLVSQAEVELLGIKNYKILSDEKGRYVFEEIYGKSSYDLVVKKLPYETYRKQITVGDTDLNLEEVVLQYPITEVSFVNAERNKNQVAIRWEKPYVAYTDPAWKGWCLDSSKNSFSAGGVGLIAACRFTPEDMVKKGIKGKKLKTVRVKLVDWFADYTIRVFQGPNAEKEIWSRHLGDKYSTRWYNIELPQLLNIDYTQDLYIGIQVADGYKEYPIAIDEGPNTDTLRSMVYFKGRWIDIKELNPKFNYHVSIMGEFVSPMEVSPSMGYKIYRMKENKKENPADWTLLNTEKLIEEKFLDLDFSEIESGYYQYAVKADYGGDRLANPVFSNTVSKGLEFDVEIRIANQDKAQDSIYVSLIHADGKIEHIYAKYMSEGEAFVFKNLWKGEYQISLQKPYFNGQFKSCTIDRDTLLEFPIFKEAISDPVITSAQWKGANIVMDWSMNDSISFYDDFEDAEDFAVNNYGPYILSSAVKKGGLRDFAWKNAGVPQSWIVFNPYTTNPPIYPAASIWEPKKSSRKYLTAMYASGQKNDDWLILPVKLGGMFSFYASGIGIEGYNEQMRLMYSTTTSNLSDFKSLSPIIEVPNGFRKYTYFCPEKTKFVAIRYVSDDILAMSVDELYYLGNGQGEPQGYEVYLDGKLIESLGANIKSFRFEKPEKTTHTLAIKAKFLGGESALVEKLINYTSSDKLSGKQDIVVYPNPSSDGFFQITMPYPAKLQIYSAQGKQLKAYHLKEGVEQLDMSTYPEGVYFFRFDHGVNIKVMKIN